MDEAEKLFPRSFKERVKEYLYDHSAPFFVNTCFAIIALIVVAITVYSVYNTADQLETAPQQTIIKVYLNEDDSIVPVLQKEMIDIKNKLDSMRRDSMVVEISKIQNR